MSFTNRPVPSMPQATMFSILLILINKRQVSRDYLAERFSVSKRTVSRYLNALEDAGVPIVSTPGRHGGVALAQDYVIDKAYLSEAETSRLKNALEITACDFADGVNMSLIEKLETVSKLRERDDYAIKQDGLLIDCEYGQAETLKPQIKTLSYAIEHNRAVEIKYADARGAVSYRTVEPYTLVFKAGAWYLYAMCKLRGDFRLFKLSRISDLRKTSKGFTRLESRLAEKLELEFYNEIYVDLELEFFPSVTDDIIDWLGISAVTERGTKLVARAEVPLTERLVKRILSFGSSVKVLQPPMLREQIRSESKRLYDIYKE